MNLIFLPGFPMNRKVWEPFVREFTGFQVHTPDLPGFGEEPILPTGFGLADVAAELHRSLSHLADPVLIGHSLGGYVSLELAKAHPYQYRQLVLFHSTALPDSEEKKASRLAVVEFIARQGVEAFTGNFITPLFANANHSAIAFVRGICLQATAEAVTGYTLAMRQRPGYLDFLTGFPGRIHFIVGESDPGISVQSIENQVQMSKNGTITRLPGVGHMGMFEAPEVCRDSIQSFITSF